MFEHLYRIVKHTEIFFHKKETNMLRYKQILWF